MKKQTTAKTCAFGCALLILLSIGGCSRETTESSNTTTRTTTVSNSSDAKSSSNSKPAADSSSDTLSKYSGDFSGAQDVVFQFSQPNADHAALTKQLKATAEDYRAIFATEEMASKAESTYAEVWNDPAAVIKPKPGQTNFKVSKISTDDIKSGAGLGDFPGGYKDAGDLFKPGLDLYKFEFKEPDKELGMSYDALVYVNGRWRFIPKPWRLAK